MRVAARDVVRFAGCAFAAAVRDGLALRALGFSGTGMPVAMSIAAIMASRTVLAIALIASLIEAAGLATGSLTVDAGEAPQLPR